jgi:hypothetical protein
MQALNQLLSDEQGGQQFGKQWSILNGTRCYVCGHDLTDPISIALGIGPICREGV